jgi:hypothetical protein
LAAAEAELLDRALTRLNLLIGSEDDRVALRAVKEVLDRTLGRPRERPEHGRSYGPDMEAAAARAREGLAALIPDVTAASTTLCGMVEWYTQCRTVGSFGTQMSWGRIEMPDANDADITNFVIEYNKRMAAGLAIPVVATTDTTIDKLLSSTYANSVGTGSFTAHVGILEACN